VPWSRLGQDPVLVYLDRIFLLAEPATQVEGCSEDAVQEAKKSRILSVELDRLAVYLDSDIIPWHVNKAWEDLLPSEWFQKIKLLSWDLMIFQIWWVPLDLTIAIIYNGHSIFVLLSKGTRS
ncbi:hypothetical protein CR513_16023, partial [Mucuna pruriens]